MHLLAVLLLLAPNVKQAPFERVDFDGDTVRVLVDRRAYLLRAVDGIETARLLAECRKSEAWRTRFRLHLVEVLTTLRGDAPGDTVSLVLDADPSGERVTIEKAPLTRRNWRKLFWQQQGFASSAPPPAPTRRLTEDQAKADAAQLDRLLRERFAYFDRKLLELPPLEVGETTVGELEKLLARRLAPFGDPNTHVVGLRNALGGRFLPFCIRPAKGGYVALLDGKLLNPIAPYVRALDARRPEEWIAAARAWLPHGTDAYVRQEGVGYLTQLEALRPFFKARPSGSVWVTLGSGDNEVRIRVEHQLAPQAPEHPDPAGMKIRVLEGGIVYLPLPHMESEEAFERHIAPMLEQLRASRAAVLDLRGNASPHRSLLRLLLPRLIEGPFVYNVAKSAQPLDDYELYPVDSGEWSDEQRAAIRKVIEGASWGDGPWHFGVVGRGEAGYRKPVAVLVDGGTRNSAEVLAYALQASGRAILVGEKTGGSDGRPAPFVLDQSRIRVSISTMASYRPDGKLFLDNSLLPDIEAAREPADWLGATDAPLARALERLR